MTGSVTGHDAARAWLAATGPTVRAAVYPLLGGRSPLPRTTFRVGVLAAIGTLLLVGSARAEDAPRPGDARVAVRAGADRDGRATRVYERTPARDAPSLDSCAASQPTFTFGLGPGHHEITVTSEDRPPEVWSFDARTGATLSIRLQSNETPPNAATLAAGATGAAAAEVGADGQTTTGATSSMTRQALSDGRRYGSFD